MDVIITSDDRKWIVLDVVRIVGYHEGVMGTTMTVKSKDPKQTRFLRQPFTIERAEE